MCSTTHGVCRVFCKSPRWKTSSSRPSRNQLPTYQIPWQLLLYSTYMSSLALRLNVVVQLQPATY